MTPPRTPNVDWSKLSDAERIGHLELEGYVVIPDLMSPELIDQVRAELALLPTKGTDYSEAQRGHSDVQWSNSPACISLIALPPMLQFLEKLFGDELICTSCVFANSK